MRSSETDSDDHDLGAAFINAVSALANGELTYRPPFDLATSAALAANLDTGRIAQALFEVTQQRDTSYRVAIHAMAPGVPEREVVNTTVPCTDVLINLLDGLLDGLINEIEAPSERNPSGG